MDILIVIFLLGGVVALIVKIFRPTSQSRVIYMPVEVVESQGANLGCMPLIVVVLFLLLALGVLRF